MKKIVLLAFVFLLFSTALVGVQVVKADIIGEYDGHPVRYTTLPYITFPRNTTYISKFLTLNVSFSAMIFANINYSMTYSLDGTPNETVPLVEHYFGWYRGFIKGENYISGFVILPELSEGSHSITVYLEFHTYIYITNADYYTYLDSDTVYFTISDTPDITPPTVTILSPENKTYNVTDVPWSFTVNESTSWIGYSLDSQTNVTIVGIAILTGLSDGMHSLIVYASDIAGNIGSSEMVYFTVDTTRPNISFFSPQNKTYTTTDIQLTFTTDETVSWMAYSLNGQANATIAGNTTLTGLSNGSHNLTIYANDTAGNTGTSETIYFSIKTEPFPVTWIVAAIVLVAVVGAALLVYFVKVKKKTEVEKIPEGVM